MSTGTKTIKESLMCITVKVNCAYNEVMNNRKNQYLDIVDQCPDFIVSHIKSLK